MTTTMCSRCGSPLDMDRQVHHNGDGTKRHYNRGECRAAEERAFAHQEAAGRVLAETATQVVAAESAVRATQKQLDYAFLLQTRYWTPAVYARRYEYTELALLDRIAVSHLIDALLLERSNQGE